MTMQTSSEYRQGRRQDVAAGGAQTHKVGYIFKYNVGCMSQQPRKKSLATCKLLTLLNRGSQPGVHVHQGAHLPILRGALEVRNTREKMITLYTF